jgi:hypothetical protein
LRDRQDPSRFPLARLPAGFADRVLISHRGVGAFAPASLSDAVYSFNPSKLSNKIRKVFHFFYKLLNINNYYSFQQVIKSSNIRFPTHFFDYPMKNAAQKPEIGMS